MMKYCRSTSAPLGLSIDTIDTKIYNHWKGGRMPYGWPQGPDYSRDKAQDAMKTWA